MSASVFLRKVGGICLRKADATVGRLFDLDATLSAMAARPFELHVELTNLCNADCVFCSYQLQTRPHAFMTDAMFDRVVDDYLAEGGGSVLLTPIVGDPLVHGGALDYVKKLRAIPQIDRIKMISNCILLDRFGAEEIVNSGLTHLTVSIAAFDEEMYRRVFRSKQYPRVRRNVLALLEANKQAGDPLHINIDLRPDRPLAEVMAFPDMQEVMAYKPFVNFAWAFGTLGGRIDIESLPGTMTARQSPPKTEACVQLYNGPIVIPDGRVVACSCNSAVDAPDDLVIGDLANASLGEIWRSDVMARLRAQFGTDQLNATCAACDIYRNLELYRTREGRTRADLNKRRMAGEVIRRERAKAAWAGG